KLRGHWCVPTLVPTEFAEERATYVYLIRFVLVPQSLSSCLICCGRAKVNKSIIESSSEVRREKNTEFGVRIDKEISIVKCINTSSRFKEIIRKFHGNSDYCHCVAIVRLPVHLGRNILQTHHCNKRQWEIRTVAKPRLKGRVFKYLQATLENNNQMEYTILNHSLFQLIVQLYPQGTSLALADGCLPRLDNISNYNST
uniref:Uncharacterized protein n=1 Tax=Glossina palpalis gambiensis TaxID=67801 RepID=A0A1B0BF94_9MUSC